MSEIDNGTYQKTSEGLKPIHAKQGYWVAVEQTKLEDIEEGETVGVWTDPETKTLWLDKVVRLTDLSNALNLGRLFKQVAIFDVVNNKEIKVN
jgi:hypothetical protein